MVLSRLNQKLMTKYQPPNDLSPKAIVGQLSFMFYKIASKPGIIFAICRLS